MADAPYIGTKSRPLFGYTGNGIDNLRGTKFGGLEDDVHFYAMGFYGGYFDSGDPANAKLGIYEEDGDHDLMAGTGAIALNDRMTENGGGQVYDDVLLTEAVIGEGGKRFILEVFGYNGAIAHGQDNTAALMYRENQSGSSLPSDLGDSTSNTETRITVWAYYEKNVKPNKPSNFSPASGASTTDTTPNFGADFSDANEIVGVPGLTLPSDYMAAYQIQVRSVSSVGATVGTLVWDSGVKVATTDERTNKRIDRDQPTALSAGQRYQWRCRMQDRCGAWSDWSHGQDAVEAWSDFLVSGAAIVTLNGTPTGRTTDTTPDFQGRYRHVSGTSSTHVKIQLWSGNTFLFETVDIPKVVASSADPGTLFTITAAESGFGTLASGTNYKYRIAAKAAGVYSDYSAFRSFKTNSKPTRPVNLRPSGGATGTIPLLTAQSTDPDGDPLTPSFRIKDADGYLLRTRAGSYDAALYSGKGGYKYQPVAGLNEIGRLTMTGSPTGGSFTVIRSSAVSGAIPWNATASQVQAILEAMSSNGVGNVVCSGGPFPATPIDVMYVKALALTNVAGMGLNSNSLTGGSSPTVSPSTMQHGADGDIPVYGDYRFDVSTSDGDLTSDVSGESVFTYAQGPVVVITSPTAGQVIDTDTPVITWTAADQVKRLVRIYDAVTDALVFTSADFTTTNQSYGIAADNLRNGGQYYVTVQVTNSAPLVGVSERVYFDLTYAAPDTIAGFQVSPDYAAQDVEPSVAVLSWLASTHPADEFEKYMIFMGDSGDTFSSATKVFESTNQGLTSWTYAFPRSGRPQNFWIVQQVRESALDVLVSVPAQASVLIDLQATVIADVRAGLTSRVYLWSTQGREEVPQYDQTEIDTWDGGTPWLFEGPGEQTVITVEAYVYVTPGASVDEQLEGLRLLAGYRDDEELTPVQSCYRDDRKRKYFGRVKGLKIRDVGLQRARVSFTFAEYQYAEVIA